jgi:hypothetical protein
VESVWDIGTSQPRVGICLACPFPLLARLWHVPSFLLAPGPHPIPTLFPTGPVKVSALADWFLYLKLIPLTRLTHCPDYGGSKDLWNAGKLLPDYTALQPRRQPSLKEILLSLSGTVVWCNTILLAAQSIYPSHNHKLYVTNSYHWADKLYGTRTISSWMCWITNASNL